MLLKKTTPSVHLSAKSMATRIPINIHNNESWKPLVSVDLSHAATLDAQRSITTKKVSYHQLPSINIISGPHDTTHQKRYKLLLRAGCSHASTEKSMLTTMDRSNRSPSARFSSHWKLVSSARDKRARTPVSRLIQ